jgi:hypothetical protein
MEISPELEGKLDRIARLPRGARIALVFGVSAAVAFGYYFMSY